MLYRWHNVKPPYGSLLQLDHELLKGLEYCFLFNDRTNSRFFKQPPNAPRKRQYITTGGYPTNTATGMYFKATNATISPVTNYSPYGNQAQSTEIAFFLGRSLSTFTDNKLTWRNRYLGIVKSYASTSIGVRWESMSGSEFRFGAWPSNKFLVAGGSYRSWSNGGITTGNVWAYYNGALTLTSGDRTHSKVAGTLQWSTNYLELNAAAGDLYGYFRWNRILSAGEHAWMAEQPWDVIKWPKPPVSYWIMPELPMQTKWGSGGIVTRRGGSYSHTVRISRD